MKCAACLLLFGLTALAQDSPRVLEGSVVNSVTGVGIDGAKITLLGNGKRPIADVFSPAVKMSDLTLQRSARGGPLQAVTDATGNFRVPGIAPGDYQVVAQKPGFSGRPLGYPIPSVGTPVHIDAAADPPHLRLELIPPATLRGRVFGVDGKPAAKVQVALGPRYETKTITGDDGAFVFENVPPGEASLTAVQGQVRTYFPAAIDAESAEPISIRPGEDQGGYEIRLQTANVYRVRGVVLNPSGKPSANSVVSLYPDQPSADETRFLLSFAGTPALSSLNRSEGVQPAREPNVVSGPDGAFEFPSVREGDWLLRAEAENIDRGVTRVDVRKNIDDVRIQVEDPLEIPGSVFMSDGSPAPAITPITVMLRSTDGIHGFAGTTDKTGSLRIEDVSPGLYRIVAIARSASYYVASVTVGDVDTSGQPAYLGDSSPPLRIVLKAGGRISGNADKGDGAKLLLIPRTFGPGDVARVYPCGAGGNFELTGIPPGDYLATAVTQFDRSFRSGIIEDLRAIMLDGTPVRVEEGALASVHLKAPVDLR